MSRYHQYKPKFDTLTLVDRTILDGVVNERNEAVELLKNLPHRSVQVTAYLKRIGATAEERRQL